MHPTRCPLLVILPIALVMLGQPAHAAGDGCGQAIEDFERIAGVVEVPPATEGEVTRLAEAARERCAAGDDDAAREQLDAAWEALLGDSALTVPTPAGLQGDPCTDGFQQVTGLMTEPQVSEFAMDAAKSLVEDARELCAEEEFQAAQDKLAMAWSMLQEVP